MGCFMKNKNLIELINYVVVGGLTTLVNFVVYFFCTHVQLHYLIANVIAWVFAVVFAYIANRKYVFKSEGNNQKAEFIQFVSLRAVTLIVESLLLFVCIQMLSMNENIAKIIVSIVTVIGNYVFCKFMIFKTKKQNNETRNMYMKLSLVVPCYNEADNVKLFYEKVEATFYEQAFDYEYIFINDGSCDQTYANLKKLVENHPQANINVINFSRNFGKESAMYAGMKESVGDYTVIIDADLQQDPAYVLRMMQILDEDENLDSVAAFQEKRREGKILRAFKSTFYHNK